jgi:multiple sugar transport system permease protein
MTAQVPGQAVVPKKRVGFQFAEKHLPFAMLLPGVVIIVLVVGLPMAYSLYLSLTDFTLTTARNFHFVGLQNYYHLLFKDALFWPVFGRTILFITIAVNLEFVIGLGIAQLMARAIHGQSLARTLMMMPMMFAPILVGLQFKWFFSAQVGLVNNLLYTITGTAHLIPWLIEKNLGLFTLLVAEIWMSTPFMVIILEAGILSLPQEPFEAADIDGASAWQKFQLLTLPMLMPFVYTAMAIRSLDIARAYDVVNMMTGGGPANRTELIWTYVNRLAFTGQQFAMGSAMSYITVIFSSIFTYMLFQNVLKSRWAGEMDE